MGSVQTAFSCDFFGSTCTAYSDGCNYCLCNDGVETACTERSCDLNNYKTGYCLQCQDGFELRGGRCTPIPSECTGLDHCRLHNGPCGSCVCNEDDGIPSCGVCDIEGDLECIVCDSGYELDCNGQCVPESTPKKQCTQDVDCDIFSDFLCLEDPLCSEGNTVCVDINFQWDCTSDADCHGGYECMPWREGMKCGKYDRS